MYLEKLRLDGRGAAIAIVIMLAVLPIMIWNIRQARKESGGGH